MEGELEVDACAAAGQQIVSFRHGLQQFTNSLASCYTQYDNNHPRVSAMRTQIVRNTLLYRELHFRASREFITGLGEVMRNYTDFSIDEFAEYIEEVADNAASYKAKAQLVEDLHIHLHSDTKTMVEEAQTTAYELGLDAEKHNEDAIMLAKKSARHNKKAEKGGIATDVMVFCSIAAAVPTGGVSLLGLLPAAAAGEYTSHHESKEKAASADSFAAGQNAQNALLAAQEIAGPMYDCVVMFSNAISQATKFFSTINNQLQTLKNEADAALTKRQHQEVQKKLRFHCIKMKKPAANLLKLCDSFLQVAPIIDSELSRICNKDENHTSYIQNWLEKHENSLELVKALENDQGASNKWEIVQRWCPFVRSKQNVNVRASDQGGSDYGPSRGDRYGTAGHLVI